MNQKPNLVPIPLQANPRGLLACWPARWPIVMLHSGRMHERSARWSILSVPRRWMSIGDGETEALEHIRQMTMQRVPAHTHLPFQGGWIVQLNYEAGRLFEPAVNRGRIQMQDAACPTEVLGRLAWCPDALLFDHLERQWWSVGDAQRWLPELVQARTASGDGVESRFFIDNLTSSSDRTAYMAAVRRLLEYIRAGDVFQVNLTRQVCGEFRGSTRNFAGRAFEASEPWYGAYLECPGGLRILSLSPELFLQVEGSTRRVVTRPIKGTRPSNIAATELIESEKDAAELHMIVDLMRNDLGRVCDFGTVNVDEPRTIETHPTVHHGVAQISGRLKHGIGIVELLRATFAPGSVTGAPKIRAMQIIEELEPVDRGPYCGTIGYISTCGNACLNVAIRTMTVDERGLLRYGTGCGIVADSDPLEEWRESEQKTEVLRRALQSAPLATLS